MNSIDKMKVSTRFLAAGVLLLSAWVWVEQGWLAGLIVMGVLGYFLVKRNEKR